MDKQPVFTIIIVTYNRVNFLHDVICSFLNQTLKNFELIIIDRGSTVSVQPVVDSFKDSRISFIKSSQDIHFADVINSATKNAKGQYLCVFGDDDIIHPKTLEVVETTFKNNKDCDIVVVGSISVVYKPDKKIKEIVIPSHLSLDENFDYFSGDTYIKFSGKDYLKSIMYEQFIGTRPERKHPCYLHPSTYFLRIGDNYKKTVDKQGGIAIKPSFDAGYLGLAYRTNIIYINAPFVFISLHNTNSSFYDRKKWNKEIQDVKFMPKISDLDNRGVDSILQVLYANNIEKEYDITISRKLWKRILKSILNDVHYDKQTISDLLKLFPRYIKSENCIKSFYYILSFLTKVIKYYLKRIIKKPKPLMIKKQDQQIISGHKIIGAIDQIYKERFEEY